MPRTKSYPPASRQSQRLHQPPEDLATDETTTNTPLQDSDDETLESPQSPDQREDQIYDSIEVQRTTPNIRPIEESEMNSGEEIAELKAMIINLQQQIDARRATPPRGDQGTQSSPTCRDTTPAGSAYGGSKFQPVGVAARPEFKTYGNDASSENPNYDRKARATIPDPAKFNGDERNFDNWIMQVAVKFELDDETFKKEKSRMAYLIGLVEGDAAKLLETRFRSISYPYASVAEMVQILATSYQDQNQASNARKELNRMMFRPGPKANIHRFIAELSAIADKAEVPYHQRKATLWEHIPAELDHRLLRDSKDPNITYEQFVENVADAAHSTQRVMERRLTWNQYRAIETRNDNRPSHSRRRPDQPPAKNNQDKTKSKTSISEGRTLTQEEKQAHWDAGTCFICGGKGHRSTECNERTRASAIRATQPHDEDVSPDSSSSESGKE